MPHFNKTILYGFTAELEKIAEDPRIKREKLLKSLAAASIGAGSAGLGYLTALALANKAKVPGKELLRRHPALYAALPAATSGATGFGGYFLGKSRELARQVTEE